ncbi:MAG: hypothetical protein IKI72_06485 [Bacteroidales bacterium]|nr:hypothetical protein [Bacteroidales bacterium]
MRRFLFIPLFCAVLLLFACGGDTDGGHVPVPDEETVDITYTLKAQSEVASLSDMLAGAGFAEHERLVTLLLSGYFTELDKPATVIDFEYPSLDPNGEPAMHSARMYVRKSLWEGKKNIGGLVLTCRPTVTRADLCPTQTLMIDGILAWSKGDKVVVIPDCYGFGSTAQGNQAYLLADATARESLDAVLAARKILAERQLGPPKRYYTEGYSQGGHTAIAVLRYLSQHRDRYLFDFTQVFAGGGPYDIRLTTEYMLTDETTDSSFAVPLFVLSYNEYEHLGLDLSQVFVEPLLSHYGEWVLSKNYTSSQICALIAGEHLQGPTGRNAKWAVTPAILQCQGKLYEHLMSAVGKHSLVSGWSPSTSATVHLYHSTEDDIVCYENVLRLEEMLESAGVKTVRHDLGGGHLRAAVPYYTDLIMALGK